MLCPRRHTQKEVVRIRTIAANPEDFNEIEELAVDVADDSDGGPNVDDVALAHEQFFCLGAYCLDDRLCQKFLLVKARYALVQVDGRCMAIRFVFPNVMGSEKRQPGKLGMADDAMQGLRWWCG